VDRCQLEVVEDVIIGNVYGVPGADNLEPKQRRGGRQIDQVETLRAKPLRDGLAEFKDRLGSAQQGEIYVVRGFPSTESTEEVRELHARTSKELVEVTE